MTGLRTIYKNKTEDRVADADKMQLLLYIDISEHLNKHLPCKV